MIPRRCASAYPAARTRSRVSIMHSLMAEPIALLALALDAAIGWPAPLYRRIGHPVGAFARFIGLCERLWNHAAFGTVTRRIAGIVTVLLLLLIAAGGGLLL